MVLVIIILIYCPYFILSFNYKPHIIFILADDLGWNDVSFHGSNQIMTPNIDALAYNGIILNNLYTQPVCTPSRASLLTGKHPIHLGMQGSPLSAAEPGGLPLSEKLLPEYLKELGYITRAVGKWHLGFYKREYTPLYRGFDSFYGYYGGFTSYYDHILNDVYANLGDYAGYDFRRNEETAWEASGSYATDLFTKEAVTIIRDHDADNSPLFLYMAHLAVHAGNSGKFLEAPQIEISKFSHITDPNRRTYAAMVSKLDENVGQIIQALETKNMLKDSVIVFMSDNGAPSVESGKSDIRYPNWGSNKPLRGVKNTLWEGGIKSPGLIWSPLFLQNARISNQLMHISDWLPTLFAAAGGDPSNLPVDLYGVNQWYTLTSNVPITPRTTMLVNIDEKSRNAAIRVNEWKLIIGSVGNSAANVNYDKQPDIDYNIKSVISSDAGQAVAEIASSLFLTHANEDDIILRRSQSTVRCGATHQIINRNTYNDSACSRIPCLFNINNDPCEHNNVAELYPGISNQLYEVLKYYKSALVPQSKKSVDVLRADPKLWNNTWSSWL